MSRRECVRKAKQGAGRRGKETSLADLPQERRPSRPRLCLHQQAPTAERCTTGFLCHSINISLHLPSFLSTPSSIPVRHTTSRLSALQTSELTKLVYSGLQAQLGLKADHSARLPGAHGPDILQPKP